MITINRNDNVLVFVRTQRICDAFSEMKKNQFLIDVKFVFVRTDDTFEWTFFLAFTRKIDWQSYDECRDTRSKSKGEGILELRPLFLPNYLFIPCILCRLWYQYICINCHKCNF
jgi:hypothetical protein